MGLTFMRSEEEEEEERFPQKKKLRRNIFNGLIIARPQTSEGVCPTKKKKRLEMNTKVYERRQKNCWR